MAQFESIDYKNNYTDWLMCEDNNRFQCVEKRERLFSIGKRIARVALGIFAVVFSLFTALASKRVRNLFVKSKETIYFYKMAPKYDYVYLKQHLKKESQLKDESVSQEDMSNCLSQNLNVYKYDYKGKCLYEYVNIDSKKINKKYNYVCSSLKTKEREGKEAQCNALQGNLERRSLNHLSDLSLKGSRVLANNRDGGHKYYHALYALHQAYEQCMKSAILTNKTISSETLSFVKDLQCNPLTLVSDVRTMNGSVIDRIRSMVLSEGYKAFLQDPKSEKFEYGLTQYLCFAKFTKVHALATFQDLVESAIQSGKDSKQSEELSFTAENIARIIEQKNELLKNAGPDFRKDVLSLNYGKLCGTMGVFFDPLRDSNVPYVRSAFKYGEKKVVFCRFGTPTIEQLPLSFDKIRNKLNSLKNQVSSALTNPFKNKKSEEKKPADNLFQSMSIEDQAEQNTIEKELADNPTQITIDPMFYGALDWMQQKGKQFLYVNHQKMDGAEGKRAAAIQKIGETRKNFHFMSIPLDGKIPKWIREQKDKEMEDFKTLVVNSFMNNENGCSLPGQAKIIREQLTALLDHVEKDWFVSVSAWETKHYEAFWGIFNTVLKHHVIQKLDIQYMNSACKDNKDRGGTFGTIDEAVRNVLLGRHKDEETLKQLCYSALAPFMIKLEEILNDRSKPDHHRLGYLLSVLEHIATLEHSQVKNIQKKHSSLCFKVDKQEFPQGEILQPRGGVK